jgi:hypothetical protein
VLQIISNAKLDLIFPPLPDTGGVGPLGKSSALVVAVLVLNPLLRDRLRWPLLVNIQVLGLGVAVSNRGLRPAPGVGLPWRVSLVSGMMAGCDRCAAGGAAVRGSA